METTRAKNLLETTTNIAILVTCIVITVGIVRTDWSEPVLPEAAPAGSVLEPIEPIQFNVAERTIILGVHSACTFCTQSMPAFRHLVEGARRQPSGKLQVVGIGRESAAVLRGYFAANGIGAIQVGSIPEGSAAISLVATTPSIVLVDKSGEVIDSWRGRLEPGRAAQILRQVDN